MSNPQQPNNGAAKRAVPHQRSGELKVLRTEDARGGHAHGTDKGSRGGGEGGAVPSEQQPDRP